MLSEFRGIIDSEGLRSFRQCCDADGAPARADSTELPYPHVPFWAVVETATATCIIRELLTGSRKRALRMLEESALTIGSSAAQ